MAQGWLAGVAQMDITPPLGVWLTGYGNRPGPASNVLDPLFVRALAVSDGERTAALVSVDLVGLSAAHVKEIRRQVAARTGIPPELLLLNASHTHAGPATMALRSLGECDPEYCALLPRWVATVVELAVRRLAPGRLAYGEAITDIGINRREVREGRIVMGPNPHSAYDRTVAVLRVDGEDGAPRTVWFSHATHGVVMGNQNTGISAEWPGAACATLRQALGGECVPLFAQGCAGDINPRRRGDFEVVRSVGRELAGAVLTAIETAEPIPSTGVAGAREVVDLPQYAPSTAEADAAVAEMKERLAQV
ncbi:MAG: neutral/alkaline non-lysosomal ceramidase N-terminal domain-containing protein, partial [Armatimonadetes bacterium]|nr:neutral/alkaline non-lysosomal ceramidase N-terminal domain-containing protein [Armatimonadota bacterium]